MTRKRKKIDVPTARLPSRVLEEMEIASSSPLWSSFPKGKRAATRGLKALPAGKMLNYYRRTSREYGTARSVTGVVVFVTINVTLFFEPNVDSKNEIVFGTE